MIHFECLGCAIEFYSPEINSVCPSCGVNTDVWLADEEFLAMGIDNYDEETVG